MMKIELTEKDFAELADLLPPMFVQTVELIGLEAAFKLVEKLGGTFVPVSANKRQQGKDLHAFLVEVLGSEEKVEILETAYFAARGLYIPKCDDVLRELRNRCIRRAFDELTQQELPMSARLAVRNLALEFKLTERRIWDIVGSENWTPKQDCLFA